MRVNYPGLKKEYAKIKQSYANRGMDLENLLNETNQYYLEKMVRISLFIWIMIRIII